MRGLTARSRNAHHSENSTSDDIARSRQSSLMQPVMKGPLLSALYPADWLESTHSTHSVDALGRLFPLSPVPAADLSPSVELPTPSFYPFTPDGFDGEVTPREHQAANVLSEPAPPPSDAVFLSSPSSASSHAPSSVSDTPSPDEQHPSSCPPAPSIHEVHRRANTQRRQREGEAVRLLDELSDPLADFHCVASAFATPLARPKRRRRSGRDKLSVLHASAVRIQQLELMLSAAQGHTRAAEATAQRVSCELDSALQRERDGLQWMDSARSLQSSSLLDDRISYLLVDWRTGQALHANTSFYAVTGFTPTGVLQRIMASPGDATQPISEVPLVCRRRSNERGCGQVYPRLQLSTTDERDDDEQCEWTPRRNCRQFPSSLLAIRDVWLGQKESCCVPLRTQCMFKTYEIPAHVWVADKEYEYEADGRRWQRPVTFVIAAPVDQHCEVEDE